MRRAHRIIAPLLFLLCPHIMMLGQSHHAKDSTELMSLNDQAYKLFLAKPDSSVALAHQALAGAVELKSHYLQGHSYYVLSKAFWAKANYRLSTEYGFKALKVFENSPYTHPWGQSLLSLARTFIDLRDFAKAATFIDEAIELSLNTSDEMLLAVAYREKSMLLSELKQYDSALYYADEGIKRFESAKDTLNASILYGRKAKIYFFLKDYAKSSHFNKMSVYFDSLAGNRRALAIAYYQSALDAIHTNNLEGAVLLLKKSIPINHEVGNIANLIKVHALLADVYLEQKQPELAAKELKLVSQYKDTLYNTEKSGQIQEMQTLYELSEKETTIQLLEQENRLKQQQVKNQRLFLAFLFASVLLLASLVFFLTRLRKIQARTNEDLEAKNTAIEQQKEEILSQAETLQELNQLKLKLFSVISHDVRGPIANLHALLELLSRKGVTPEEFVSLSVKIKSNLGITQRTLENLLNWSMSQMEGIRTQRKNLNIKNAIDDVRHLMEENALQKGIVIENHCEDFIEVSADPSQLQLILRNLIHNAIKFSKPQSQVKIYTTQDDVHCEIIVKDSGIGMTPAEVEAVLDARRHFSKTGTQQEKGTGLGLLLCREFIKNNGGEFRITSYLNEGTEVRFTLPLATTPILS